MDLYQTIGQQIKRARKEQGVGQKVLASMLGYTPPSISQYESGKRYILLTDLEKIAVALNRPLTYFLTPTERPSEKKKKYIQVPLKQYKMINEARKLKSRFKELEHELRMRNLKNKKLENKVQNLMTRIAEQAQITNQTAQLYNELKRNEEKYREAERITVASKIAQNVAYQLNNPLTALLGFIQILIFENHFKTRYNTQNELKRLESITKRCIEIIAKLINSFARK